jgi:hypothetical protein
MTEPVTITIGGEAVTVPPVMNFALLKRAWPAIRRLGETQDVIERLDAAVGIVAAALMRARPELTAEEIAERLKPEEMAGLFGVVPTILDASGLVPPGEARPVLAPAKNSTAISTGSSPG